MNEISKEPDLEEVPLTSFKFTNSVSQSDKEESPIGKKPEIPTLILPSPMMNPPINNEILSSTISNPKQEALPSERIIEKQQEIYNNNNSESKKRSPLHSMQSSQEKCKKYNEMEKAFHLLMTHIEEQVRILKEKSNELNICKYTDCIIVGTSKQILLEREIENYREELGQDQKVLSDLEIKLSNSGINILEMQLDKATIEQAALKEELNCVINQVANVNLDVKKKSKESQKTIVLQRQKIEKLRNDILNQQKLKKKMINPCKCETTQEEEIKKIIKEIETKEQAIKHEKNKLELDLKENKGLKMGKKLNSSFNTQNKKSQEKQRNRELIKVVPDSLF